jgi:hypothetical protein
MLRFLCCAAALAVAAFVVSAPSPALAQDFVAELTGQNQVPPVTTTATGSVEVTASTYGVGGRRVAYTIECSGLSGPITAAHFHGPAAEGENAGPLVPIEGTACPLEGTVTLNAEQAGHLSGGMIYVNIHTAANPDGEIRGQLEEDS